MVSNEKKKEDMKLQPFSWWCDSSQNRPHQSQWLQTNLSELDEKIKVMLSIIEEDGDSFAKRAEMYYKRRPQLIKVLEDLHKSYRSLAEKYDQLRSDNHSGNPRSFSPFRSLRQIQNFEAKLVLPETPTSENNSTSIDHETCDHDHHLLNNAKKTIFQTDDIKKDTNGIIFGGDFEVLELRDKAAMWSQKEVSELIEDHLKQQAELVRRNEEKREKINELRCQINRLLDENGVLKSCLASSKVDKSKRNQSKTSPLFLGKLTGCAS